MLGIKPSSSQQKRGFVPPLLPFHTPTVILASAGLETQSGARGRVAGAGLCNAVQTRTEKGRAAFTTTTPTPPPKKGKAAMCSHALLAEGTEKPLR